MWVSVGRCSVRPTHRLATLSCIEWNRRYRQFHGQLAKAMRTERDRLEHDNEERTRAERERVGQLLETQARKNDLAYSFLLFAGNAVADNAATFHPVVREQTVAFSRDAVLR